MLAEVHEKSISIDRLRNLVFGKTERFTGGATLFEGVAEQTNDDDQETTVDPEPKPKPKGHGRRKINLFAHTEQTPCPAGHLKSGETCPECASGTMYSHRPQRKTCIRQGNLIIVQEFEIENLRCGSCHHVEKADEPQVLKECVGRYHFSIIAALCMFRYHAGMPSHRMKNVTKYFGLEIPDTTQFTLFEACADMINPVWKELWHRAAKGKISYRDDTPNRIVDLKKRLKENATGDPKARVGITTTAIVAVTNEGRKISLYKTNAQHAGEVFDLLLKLRQTRDPMLSMADASSQNRKHKGNVIELGCLVHARRNFYELKDCYPNECEKILSLVKKVFKLREGAGAEMQKIYDLCQAGVLKHGENTSMYKAYRYVINHWVRLTGFLQHPGAPLDNNEVERDLKRPIRHRKNSLFFKTTVGATVGDIITSVIATAIRADINPVLYLEDLMRYADDVAANPSRWLPWEYRTAKQTRIALQ